MPEPKQSNALAVPDYLLEALAQEEELGTTDVFVGNQPEFPRLRRVIFPARTGKYAPHFGKLIIEGANENEREVVDYIDFLLVDNHVLNHMTAHDWMLQDSLVANALDAGIYPRTFWEHDRQGRPVQTATRPMCSSSNGIDTWASNRETDVYDFRTGKTVKIGFGENSDSVARFACLECPLGKWQEVPDPKPNDPDKTKKLPPICRETPQAVIYDIEREELLVVQGSNRSVGISLKGSRGKFGRRFDDVPFKGIEYNFAYVTGKDLEVDGKAIATFRNRPEGKPSMQNPTAPTIAVRMTVTLNNFTPASQAAPDFTLLDGDKTIQLVNQTATPPGVDGNNPMQVKAKVLTPQEYGKYLQVKRTVYDEPGTRSRMMGLNYLDAFATDDAVAALPAGVEDLESFDKPFSK